MLRNHLVYHKQHEFYLNLLYETDISSRSAYLYSDRSIYSWSPQKVAYCLRFSGRQGVSDIALFYIRKQKKAQEILYFITSPTALYLY